MKYTNLLIVDSDLNYALTLAEIIRVGNLFDKISVTDSAKKLLRFIRVYPVNLIMIHEKDIREIGVSTIRLIKLYRPETKVIILNIFDSQNDLYLANEAGVDAYMLKSTYFNEIFNLIDNVMNSSLINS